MLLPERVKTFAITIETANSTQIYVVQATSEVTARLRVVGALTAPLHTISSAELDFANGSPALVFFDKRSVPTLREVS